MSLPFAASHFRKSAAPLILVALLAVTAYGQAAYKAPRTADNQPDLQGIWQSLGTAYINVEAHAATTGAPAGLSIVTDPPDGKIPYLPAALAKREQNARNPAKDPVNSCFMTGVPRFLYMPYPIQIFQTGKEVLMTSEFIHGLRNIFFDPKDHLDGVDFWNGDSRAHWEGDTLVVDVTNFNGDTWFDRSGNYHSDGLHVTERYTRTSPHVLNYEATIEDPKTFSRPWKVTVPLYRHQEKNFRLLEYECRAYIEENSPIKGGK